MSTEREPNPFEDKEVAEQWILSVEGERGMIRDKEIYPMLEEWGSGIGLGKIVEIGSGQGVCSLHLGDFASTYIGIEPSLPLVERAKELYGRKENLRFEVGNAYALPLEASVADGAFSVNVWFHLADLATASRELARILKRGGVFNIITTNPKSYEVWKGFFEDYTIDGKLLSGKVNLPVTPLSRNDFYMHSEAEMTDALQNAGLSVTSVIELGTISKFPNNPLFVSIQGRK